jgi:NAD(P)-dependent dehydrogenase (short-subunit alcohol dehydrogenase family)
VFPAHYDLVSPGTDHYSGSSSHPIGRLIEPEEIAELVAWLCSDQAAMVNGTLVAADTGWHVA